MIIIGIIFYKTRSPDVLICEYDRRPRRDFQAAVSRAEKGKVNGFACVQVAYTLSQTCTTLHLYLLWQYKRTVVCRANKAHED